MEKSNDSEQVIVQQSEASSESQTALSAPVQVTAIPTVVANAGEHASRRFLEFFAATIRNKNTRVAYYHAACRFFDWCETYDIDLIDIEPLHIAAYVEYLGQLHATPTTKQHLAALRMLFNWLVTGHVIQVNPATSVRGPKHVVKSGITPVLSAEEARQLLDSIDASTPIGLRDRALIALMTYTFARVSAALAMNVGDYYPQGKRWWVRLHEKGGKLHQLPAHHNLEAYLDEYIRGAGLEDAKNSPLFRKAKSRNSELTEERMGRRAVYRMIQRRALAAGLLTQANCHTFRATGITAYLNNGGLLEHAQTMANHESPRTTKLYDRTGDEITLDEVEKISI